jgi:lysine-ketoglutarate reductase/saccharopine dehydrogenase-like protein (TIGR00300 family)
VDLHFQNPHARRFVSQGHLVDSGALTRILNLIVEEGADYEVLTFKLGKTNQDESHLELEVRSAETGLLESLADRLVALGCYERKPGEGVFRPAPRDGVAPEEFYSTTHHRTEVYAHGRWRGVRRQRMDGVVVLEDGEPVCRKLRDLRAGQQVLCGSSSVRLSPPARDRDARLFGFMQSEVSSERSVDNAVRRVAEELRLVREAGGRIVAVAGPVVVHTGGAPALAALVKAGYVHGLLAGNALAVHDVECALYGTSLGVDLNSGRPVDQGHRNHMRAINKIAEAGSLAAAVERGALRSGIMYEAIRAGVPFALAGSIRDDGPLPETINDMIQAQDVYERILENASLVLMLGSMLHSIAAGNMLPSWIKAVCVDIAPPVITKLADRGSAQTVGIVTDAGQFLRGLAAVLLGSS